MLWSPQIDLVDSEASVLKTGSFHYLAIANPKLAPYGKAAQQVLTQQTLWKSLQHKLVRGENIGQAFQFVKSANAELGFVAFSQIKNQNKILSGSFWKIPQSLYDPILQQAVLLKNKQATRDFLLFVKTDQTRKIIRSFGYGVADAE